VRVFTACIATETNTFAPVPTGMAAYEENGVYGRGEGRPDNEIRPAFDALARWAAAEGHELVQGLGIYATPGGITRRAVWEALRDELLEGLSAAGPVDAVVLPLHGAMVAEGYPDCEGDLLERVRAAVGPRVPIGVLLDLHCHYTERMQRHADLLVAFKEYPHTDVVERLEEAWALTLRRARGEIEPVTSVRDCRMVGFWHTTKEPMRSFVRRMQDAERLEGILSVNFGHGFQYGDVADMGAKVWVVSDRNYDGDGSKGAALATRLRDELWAMREAARVRLVPLDAALDRIARAPAGLPLVLADCADNAGGGAASDSTFVLRRLLERGIGDVAIGAYWDALAAATALEAGVGARFEIRVGGKYGRASGDPVDLWVTVRATASRHVQTGLGASYDCGQAAWLRTDAGIDIVVISKRHQVFGTDLFTGLGIDLASKRAVVVKSAQHFYPEFAPIASDVLYVATPGLLRDDVENLPYVHRDPNFWPRVAEPWKDADGDRPHEETP
jgi:microcystin degradation protein MlrC